MAGFAVPGNQAVSFTVYSQAIANETRLTHEFLSANARRIERAFDMGEPIWMVAAELRLVAETAPVRPTKTPRDLAIRVVRAAP